VVKRPVTPTSLPQARLLTLRLSRCPHPEGQELIPKIQVQVRNYCETLDQSVAIAIAGVHVADNAKNIYWQLAGMNELTSETLESLLTDVQEEARDIKKRLSDLVSQLRGNRQGIIAVRPLLLLLTYFY
jgi:hypothetical protein